MIDLIWILFIFAVGASVGSFLNVVIYRLPRNESIVFPPSHCPHCGRGIHWYDNIPILAWLWLRARCRFCKGPISPQYVLVELFTGLLLVGLYVAYFMVGVRQWGVTQASELTMTGGSAMFAAHALLLCGLLATAAIDMRWFLVPLPVMWICAGVGALAAAVQPHPFLPWGSPVPVAMSIAAAGGVALSLWAVRKGYLTPSFIDATPARAADEPVAAPPPRKGKKKRRKGSGKSRGGIAFGTEHGVNPRLEVLREVLFLAPALVLAGAAWAVLWAWPELAEAWAELFSLRAHPLAARLLAGAGGSLFGFLIGGLWIWGTRILGTLAFGREAMGMGDVHILAAVGAVAGWDVASLTFFVAPLSGLLVVLWAWLARRQQELPYGPWLAVGTLLVLLGYDWMAAFLAPGLEALFG